MRATLIPFILALALPAAAEVPPPLPPSPTPIEPASPVNPPPGVSGAAYREQLLANLQGFEKVAGDQERAFHKEERRLGEMRGDLIAEAGKPDSGGDAADSSGGIGGGKELTPLQKKTQALSQQTYHVMIAKSELEATRRRIRDIQEALAAMPSPTPIAPAPPARAARAK